MSRAFAALSCAVLFSSLAAGQSTETKSAETKPAFEISDDPCERPPPAIHSCEGPPYAADRFEIATRPWWT